MYDILHFIVDNDFVKELISKNSTPRLKTSILFLPIAKSSKTLDYYYSLPSELGDGVTNVVAMELGLRDVIFDQLLISDLAYVGISATVITLLMFLYTKSVAVTLMVILSIFMALGVSYFVYTTVFGITFFPFINCMAIIICLGEYDIICFLIASVNILE